MIRGTTELVAHIGYPTATFKSPMIYNPYFEQAGIDAVVVPMSCEAERYPAFLKSIFTLTNTAAPSSRCRIRSEPSGCSMRPRPP